MLINCFLDNNDSLSKLPRAEFVDNGYTGTSFDSPQFQTMMNQVIQLAEHEHIQRKQAAEKCKNAVDKAKRLQFQAEQLKAAKLRLYEKYAADEISREAYLKAKAELDGKLAVNERELKEATLDSPKSDADTRLIEICNSSKGVEKLTHDLAHAFIKAIYVYPEDRAEIEWKFGKPDGI